MKVLGFDHLYLTVSDLGRSERFYDAVMERLGFRKSDTQIAGEPHAHYFTPSLQISIRPARTNRTHDPYAPGLHHVCVQLATRADVDAAAKALRELGVAATEPRLYPEYNPDYYATFFEDPDRIRLELVARMPYRDELREHWDEFRVFLNPLRELRARKG
jgi:catechol 2,3-dioxygenase-like lactoylglutathione lyase family enzyme